MKSIPEYVIRSLPIIETTGLLMIIVWTQISAIIKKILLCFCHCCSVVRYKPVCFTYSVNQSHVSKMHIFFRCRKHSVERIIVSVYFFFLKLFSYWYSLSGFRFLSSLFDIFLIAWWIWRAVFCLCFELLFRCFTVSSHCLSVVKCHW